MRNKKSRELILDKAMESIKKTFSSVGEKPLSRTARIKTASSLVTLLWAAVWEIIPNRTKAKHLEFLKFASDRGSRQAVCEILDRWFSSSAIWHKANLIDEIVHVFGWPEWGSKKIKLLRSLHMIGRFSPILVAPWSSRLILKAISYLVCFEKKRSKTSNYQRAQENSVLHRVGAPTLGVKDIERWMRIYIDDLLQEKVIWVPLSHLIDAAHPLSTEQMILTGAIRVQTLLRTALASPRPIENARIILVPDTQILLDAAKNIIAHALKDPEFSESTLGVVIYSGLSQAKKIHQALLQISAQRQQLGSPPLLLIIAKGEGGIENQSTFLAMVDHAATDLDRRSCHHGFFLYNALDLVYIKLRIEERALQEDCLLFSYPASYCLREETECQLFTKEQRIALMTVAAIDEPEHAARHCANQLSPNSYEGMLETIYPPAPHTTGWNRVVEKWTQLALTSDASPQEQPLTDSIEKPTDFRLPSNQEWARALIQEWQNKKIAPVPLVIAGGEKNSAPLENQIKMARSDGEEIEPLYQYQVPSLEDLNEALEAAKAAERAWNDLTLEGRKKKLEGLLPLLRARQGSLCGVMLCDGYRIISEGAAEVDQAVDLASYYLQDGLLKLPEIDWHPKGTVCLMNSWKQPVSLGVTMILAALITGNCVLFAPAKESILTGWAVASLFWELGVPKEVLQFIPFIDYKIMVGLASDARINAFYVEQSATFVQNLLKQNPSGEVFSLIYGHNAMIISAQCDKYQAIQDILESAFSYNGQLWNSAHLLLLDQELYDKASFKSLLCDAAQSLPIRHCWELEAHITPLAKAPDGNLATLLTQTERGSAWLLRPEKVGHVGNWWSPGIKWGVSSQALQHTPPWEGPLLHVSRASSSCDLFKTAHSLKSITLSTIHSRSRKELGQWQKVVLGNTMYSNLPMTVHKAGATLKKNGLHCAATAGYAFGGENYLLHFIHLKKRHERPLSPPQQTSSDTSLWEPLLLKCGFDSDEVIAWKALASNFLHWNPFFKRSIHYSINTSPARPARAIVNYRAEAKTCLRIQQLDKLMDVSLAIYAATIANDSVEISWAPEHKAMERLVQEIRTIGTRLKFICERDDGFYDRVIKPTYTKIRLLSPASHALISACHDSKSALTIGTPKTSGRIELLRHYKEYAQIIEAKTAFEP